jgi:hypothetical protein
VSFFWVILGKSGNTGLLEACVRQNKICEVCGNEETTSLWLRACLRCTAGGCRDGCDRESWCDESVYECLGEVR